MEKIAFIGEGVFVYWSSILVALGALAAALIYAAVYIKREGNFFALCTSIFLSVLFSIPLARLVHWYCKAGLYDGIAAALTDYTTGGFALLGVFVGCFLAAALLRLIRISKSLPGMLDCMSIGAGVGIAVGRLASLFNGTDRGVIVGDQVKFPFAYELVNVVSGTTQNRLATFMIQSFVAAAITVMLLVYMFVKCCRKQKIPKGDIFLMFLMTYSASQIVCDSTRYDALVLRSNGFISMVQVVSLVGMFVPVIIFAVQMVKKTRLKAWYFALWAVMAGVFGLACYMEYIVQNNGHKALMAYSTMSGCLAVVVVAALVMRYLARKNRPVSAETVTAAETV